MFGPENAFYTEGYKDMSSILADHWSVTNSNEHVFINYKFFSFTLQRFKYEYLHKSERKQNMYILWRKNEKEIIQSIELQCFRSLQ
jgi:hypothetical protein